MPSRFALTGLLLAAGFVAAGALRGLYGAPTPASPLIWLPASEEAKSAALQGGRHAANPGAEPGQVRWHATPDAALAAARASGKPVLVFHMLGRLDQRFC